MASTYDQVFPLQSDGLQVAGLLKKRIPTPESLPLVVFIHGGGANAAYFDNPSYSYPAILSERGHNVLSIQRPGYGGNPIPTVASPVLTSIPLITELIAQVYRSQTESCNGVILVGHSLGAAIALAIAAQSDCQFPVIGVSVLGVVPTLNTGILIPDPDPEPDSLRVEFGDVPTVVSRFFGPFECLDEKVFTADTLQVVFEPGVRAEIREFTAPDWYYRLVDQIFPTVKVPVQYLAGEHELVWQGTNQAQSRFDHLAKLFTASSDVEAKLLAGGGHNYEFTRNSARLHHLRLQFISKMSEKSASYSAAFTSIPILDFSRTLSPSTKPTFLAHLREALINVGFFYLQNPPVSAELQNAFSTKALELFQLSLEKKLEIKMVNSPHFLGYSRLGAEITALKPDHREQFDFATELPAPGPDEPLYRNICGPNQWPDEEAIPGCRRAIESYLSEVSDLAASFTVLIAEALDLAPTAFDQAFDNPQQHKLKLIKYPPPPTASDNRAGFQGVGAHKDSGFLTFLLQATPHHGLEVQNKAGDWIPAPPLPNAFVVNIGRALEALTGGVCTATTHRVSLREEHFVDADGNLMGPRFSFPVFQGVSPDLSADKISLVIPAHIRDLVKDDKVKSDAEATFNEMFRTIIGEGTFVARVTSHQDVGQRWYPGVLAKALKGQKDFVAR